MCRKGEVKTGNFWSQNPSWGSPLCPDAEAGSLDAGGHLRNTLVKVNLVESVRMASHLMEKILSVPAG